MRAYYLGCKLAALDKYSKDGYESVDNPETAQIQEDIDVARDEIAAERRYQWDKNRSLEQHDPGQASIGEVPVYSDPYSRMSTHYRARLDEPRRLGGKKLIGPRRNYIRVASGANPVRKVEDGSPAGSQRDYYDPHLTAGPPRNSGIDSTYVNPITLAHEYGHAKGYRSELDADAFAAVQDYDLYDLADFYNRHSNKMDHKHDSHEGHAPASERTQMFAGRFAGGSNLDAAPRLVSPPEAVRSKAIAQQPSLNWRQGGRLPTLQEAKETFYTYPSTAKGEMPTMPPPIPKRLAGHIRSLRANNPGVLELPNPKTHMLAGQQ